ncbi:MAG: glycosyltransferase family 4 protein [Candidatus Moranbacteria bacterium]|nr:glycosyltransferase family 4 protein [Candidatus Moranbacteria bacterium]
MKIAFIGQKGLPAKNGGVEKHVEEIAKRMAGLGHQVFVYVRSNYTSKELTEFEGIKLIHLPSISTKHLDAISHTFLASVHSLFQKYDVAHFHGIGPAFFVWLPKLFNRQTKVIATFHYQDYHHKKWGWFAKWFLRLGESVACKVADKTIVVNEALQLVAEKKYGVKTVLIPNGSEISYSQDIDAISKWNLKDKKYLLSVGRLAKSEGVHFLIEAFKQLENTARISNNFKLVIVGEGLYGDDYAKYLHTISEGRDNIVFAGSQKGETLEQFFSHAYLFVQPSQASKISIALLEAMNCGTTPLVSDVAENITAIDGDGFSFTSGSMIDLRDKLAFLLSRPDEVKRFGIRARKKMEEKYSWDAIVKKTLEIYEKVTKQYKS